MIPVSLMLPAEAMDSAPVAAMKILSVDIVYGIWHRIRRLRMHHAYMHSKCYAVYHNCIAYGIWHTPNHITIANAHLP
jgi:fumarate reductase subunit D